jgi:hypothetical protein
LLASRKARQAVAGTQVKDNRAVGNSRLAHRDVLSVSLTWVPGIAPEATCTLASKLAPTGGSVTGRGILSAGNGECP